jgi:predicted Zn-dependent protease
LQKGLFPALAGTDRMPFDLENLVSRFRRLAPAVDYCALRVVHESHDTTVVRQDVALPPRSSDDGGAMVTVIDGDGLGYGATADLSDDGLRWAIERACRWAALSRLPCPRRRGVIPPRLYRR